MKPFVISLVFLGYLIPAAANEVLYTINFSPGKSGITMVAGSFGYDPAQPDFSKFVVTFGPLINDYDKQQTVNIDLTAAVNLFQDSSPCYSDTGPALVFDILSNAIGTCPPGPANFFLATASDYGADVQFYGAGVQFYGIAPRAPDTDGGFEETQGFGGTWTIQTIAPEPSLLAITGLLALILVAAKVCTRASRVKSFPRVEVDSFR